jgi:hypothetical protein
MNAMVLVLILFVLVVVVVGREKDARVKPNGME